MKKEKSNQRILLILLVITIIAYTLFLSIRDYYHYPRYEKPKSTLLEEQKDEESFKEKSKEIVLKWYEYSDKNDIEGLKGILSKNWHEPQNKELLERILSQWSYNEEELSRGYWGETVRKEVKSAEVLQNVYGSVVLIKVDDEFNTFDELGNQYYSGESIFLLTIEGSGEVKIREISWKVISNKLPY